MKTKAIRKAKPKPVEELTEAELDEMSAEFDREFVADTFRPLTSDEAEQWERLKRKRGRPRVGAGSRAISVTVEISLLERIDRIVKLRKTTRASLISRGLRAVLKEEEAAAR